MKNYYQIDLKSRKSTENLLILQSSPFHTVLIVNNCKSWKWKGALGWALGLKSDWHRLILYGCCHWALIEIFLWLYTTNIFQHNLFSKIIKCCTGLDFHPPLGLETLLMMTFQFQIYQRLDAWKYIDSES